MAGKEAEGVYYVKYDNDKGQYKILPILISVLVDQDHIQDFLVELENSPMSIQVMDIELSRPHARVTKPQKGDVAASGFGGMSGAMGSMMSRMRGGEPMGMGRGMTGFGGMMGEMAMRSRMGGAGAAGAMGMRGMGMGMGAGSTTAARKGTDVRNENRAKERDKASKALEQVKGPSLFDPHFDIVQVTVYGQARFFNPPPADEQAQPSLGDTAAAAGPAASRAPAAAPAAPGATGANTATPPTAPATGSALAKQPAPAAEAPKAEAAAAAPAKAEAPKPDASKPAATKGDSKSAAPKS